MINRLLWIIYLALLAVLLPHTAWAFNQFETPGAWGIVTAWAAAFAFEAAIAALTHKLARHIERRPKRLAAWPKLAWNYLNAYSVGLCLAVGVSVLANLAHAVQFGQALAIFAQYGIPAPVYAVAFGAVLPGASLLFARVLSNEVDGEDAPNPEAEQAKAAAVELRRKLADAERARQAAEQKAAEAEARFQAAGDLFVMLRAAEKRERILFARKTWPQLAPGAIAIITEASPSYVSDVLKESESV